MGRLRFSSIIFAAICCALFGCAPAYAQRSSSQAAGPLCSALANQQLKCQSLGFTYKAPFGWVDRTEDMQPANEATAPAAGKDASAEASSAKATSGNSETLLAVFERPPEASGEGIDSAVIIAAESVANYPTIKAPADYFGPLSDIAEKRGLKMDGDPYEFAVGSKRLVRGDFVAGDGKTAAHQTSLVMIERGYIISFTFVSDSEDEIENLVSGLSFTAHSRSGAKAHK